MVAVGLWGAQLGAPAIWVLPVAFPLVMAFGGNARPDGSPPSGIEIGIAASALLLGAAVMFEVRAPLVVTALLVAFFAIFHGHAHGTELPPGQSPLLYSVGFVIATGCLHATGIGIGAVHRWSWGRSLSGRPGPSWRSGAPSSCGRRWREAPERLRFALGALLGPGVAEAHLNSTGMGPLYDGLVHFLTSPEDLVPALGLALLAGLRGAAFGRRAALALPSAWLLGVS